jgi:hypothetical protein
MGFTAVNEASQTGETWSSVRTLASEGPLNVPGKSKRAGSEGEEDMLDDSVGGPTSPPGYTG